MPPEPEPQTEEQQQQQQEMPHEEVQQEQQEEHHSESMTTTTTQMIPPQQVTMEQEPRQVRVLRIICVKKAYDRRYKYQRIPCQLKLERLMWQ